jgi:hypothetical protein
MAEAFRSGPRGSASSREPAQPNTVGRKDSVVVTPEDLPPAGTRQWVPRYKAAVVAAVDAGVLTLEDARRRYLLSEEELESWRDAIDHSGIGGLRMSVSERRAAPRTPVSKSGVARLNASEGVDCLIADVSDGGARLELEASVRLPHLFELGCDASGRSWWVELVWQRGGAAGVRFTNPLSPPFAIRSGLGAWLVGSRDTVEIDRLI